MPRERTLLERIARREGGETRRDGSTAEDLNALMDSVRNNITHVLNSRQGMSECVPDYGLPAMSDMVAGHEDYVRQVQDAVRLAVEKYEPRLRRVRVSRLSDEEHAHTLAFRIDAVLPSRSGEHRVWYQTEITGAGQFFVYD
ncbi:MAG: type VI secretion system baseplate subunit TssE [Planctomycetes bacterium]|nr:type VI secretion system baseplate subunit TssE [Planctomycetota bacterium]